MSDSNGFKAHRIPHNCQFRRQYKLTGKLLGVGGFALVYEAVCTQDAVWGDSRWTFRVAKVRVVGFDGHY